MFRSFLSYASKSAAIPLFEFPRFRFSPGLTQVLLAALLGWGLLGQASAQISVTATAGTTGPSPYTTLKGAFDAINAGTHQGVITIAVTGDTTETASAVLNASGSGAAVYTSIGISPTGGAARTITGAITAGSPLIDLNGADNVTIDGLNTGGNSLTIANTTASATSGTSTIRFIGGATNNLITNSNLQGSASASVATNGATIFFSTDAVTTNGNDNNTISNNNIGPAGANLPSKAILGNGSTTTTALGNSGIIINNNNIFDYFAAAVTSSGIATNGGCNTWTITNNRLYQTAARTWTTGALHAGIDIRPTTATSGAQAFTITGNTIGFASSAQTGVYTLTGAGTGAKFLGILFNGIAAGTTTNINNNTVAGISMSGVTSAGTTTASPFTALLLQEGNIISNGNTIGSQSVAGSLTFSTTTTTATDVYGIHNFTSNAWTSNNNTVGGISVTNLGASGTILLVGIRAFTGSTVNWSATGNTVGGSVANSLQLNATGTASQVLGMFTSNAPAQLTSNTIRNLTSNIGTGTSASASVIGVNISAATPNHTLSQNTISNLTNSNASAASVVTGIQFTGATANVVERNFIHSLSAATNSATAEVNGIRVAGGTTIYRNNMIALGAGIANALGAAASNGGTSGINGINEFLGTNSFFHNSVYIGGSASAGTGASYAFNGTQTTNTRSFRDNIFWNARSNGGATGKHYAIKINGTTPNPTGLTLNNNIYFANGSGGVLGFFNSLDVANIAAWRAAVGQDAGSFETNPQYVDPTNATPDLHLNASIATAAEGNGVDLGVSNDFDGQTRSGLTPTDIGADAGNYIGLDLAAPNITYSALGNTALTGNRTLVATITDTTGVATGGLAPRIYYRKNAGTYFSQACTLATGTITNGTWNCVISVADFGGLVSADVVGYFVIAQDVLGNISSSPAGVVATDVSTVSTPPTPNTFSVVTGYSGPINVGTTETFTSLTNAGGIFEALNNGVLTGNVTINITSDLITETGTNALNQWAEDGVGGYTLLIKPSGAPRVVRGTNAGALIRLNGTDRARIDGSTLASRAGAAVNAVGGNPALRELTIQNTNTGTSAVVLAIQSGTAGAQNNTLINVNFIGQDPTTTLAALAIGGATPGTAGTDNDGNRIENCSFKRSIYGMYAAGQNAANPDLGMVITANDLSSTGADRVRRIGIVVFNQNGVQITENSVGGLDTNESADGIGIGVGTQGIDNASVTNGGVTNAVVARNRISGVLSQSATGFSAAGIAVAGGTGGANLIANNMITGVSAPATSPDLVAGIYVAGVVGSNTRIIHNSVSLSGDRGTVATQMPSFGLAVTGTDPTLEVKNNAFVNTQIASGGGVNAKSYAIGLNSTAFANLDSNFNDYFTSGANAGFYRSGSLNAGAGTDYATIAAFGAAISDEANSQQLDPLFVSTSDLHLQPASALGGDGTPIAGVSVDLDGDARSSTAPTVGADELSADLAITKTDGVTSATPGGSVTYTITASNAGASATNATVADVFPASLTCTWTCVGAGGGTCTASGSGNVNDPVSLPTGGSVTYTAACAISSSATGNLVNTASVTGALVDPTPANNSATDTDTLTPSADLGITKTDGVTTAVPGNSVTYTITASNAGPSDTAATVADTFPANLTCTWTCVGAGGGTCTASGSGNINDSVSLPSGGSVTFTATCAIASSATGSLSNTATVSGVATDPAPANNSATDTDTLIPSADVAITKTDGVTTVAPGGNTTYTIVAANAGPSNTSATIADTFPAVLTCSWTCTGAGGATCAAGGSGNINDNANLPSGGSVTYTATCAISAAATGTLSNTATVSVGGGVTDPTPANNSATDVDTLVATADLGITKTDGVTTATAGGNTTYTIVASNAGPSNTTATVADTFPAVLTCTWTCAGAGGGTCTASGSGNISDSVNLPSGGSVTYTAACSISGSATGSLVNTATVTGAASDPAPGNNSATDTDALGASADLAITKTDGVSTVTAGGSITYTIVASNAGPSAANGSTVADTFPAALTCTWTCVGAGGGTCTASGAGNINDTVNLPSGGSVTYTASCTISAGATGSLSNTATVAAPAGVTDPTPGNNSATDTDTIAGSGDLSITKTDGVSSVTAGGSATYTITASNAGPSTATGATVTDTFPAALTCTWTCVGAGGGTCTASGSGNLSDTVNLPASGSVTYTATCAINAGASGNVANTATVTAPGGFTDTNAGNNSATDTDTVTASADLSITKTDGVSSVVAGSSTTYTITASNAGPSNASGTTVADVFPAGLTCTWACVGAGAGTCTASGSGNINDTVNLPSGGSVTYTATCAIAANVSGNLSNTATVTAAGSVTDPISGNNSATDTDTVSAAPGAIVSASKTVSGSFSPGSPVTYTITLSNTGPAAQADNASAEFVDTLPTGLTFVSASASSGTATAVGNVVSWNGSIPAAGSVTITIQASINGTASGLIVNQGTAFFDADGNGSNESSASTDDPGLPGNTDGTGFQVLGVQVPVPALDRVALILLALMVLGFAYVGRRSFPA